LSDNPLRQRFESITLDTIRDFVKNEEAEDLHLDFKIFAGSGKFSDEEKRSLAKALSGFANSDGGFIICA